MNNLQNTIEPMTQFDYELITGCITRGVPAFSNELINKIDRIIFENNQLSKQLKELKDSIDGKTINEDEKSILESADESIT